MTAFVSPVIMIARSSRPIHVICIVQNTKIKTRRSGIFFAQKIVTSSHNPFTQNFQYAKRTGHPRQGRGISAKTVSATPIMRRGNPATQVELDTQPFGFLLFPLPQALITHSSNSTQSDVFVLRWEHLHSSVLSQVKRDKHQLGKKIILEDLTCDRASNIGAA